MKDLTITQLQYTVRDDSLVLEKILAQLDSDATVSHIDIIQSFPQLPRRWEKYPGNSYQLLCFDGSLKLVLFDDRRDSDDFGSIKEIRCGEHQLQLIHIPAGVYVAWQALGGERASLLRCSSESLEALETSPIDTHLIPYQWKHNS